MVTVFRSNLILQLFLALVLLPQVACAPAEVPMLTANTEYLSKKNIPLAQGAMKIFTETCLPLMSTHAKDIESVSIQDGAEKTDYGCMDYRCEEYGWTKSLRVKVKIKDRPATFSGNMRRIAGHTLHFFIGGPNNPGYTTTKFPQVCGVEKPKSGDDVYVSVPEMKVLW